MLHRMKRISVQLDDAVADAVEEAAGGSSVSSWIADVVRRRLVEEAAAEAGEYDAAHDDPEWERQRLAGAA